MKNGELDFIGIINVLDFCLEFQTLNEWAEIHKHLAIQDEKLNQILTLLEGIKDEDK